jgi:hypothetical protein
MEGAIVLQVEPKGEILLLAEQSIKYYTEKLLMALQVVPKGQILLLAEQSIKQYTHKL